MFVERSLRSWILNIAFVARSYRSWILDRRFVARSYRSWILDRMFVARSYRSWILDRMFVARSNRSWILDGMFVTGSCGSWIWGKPVVVRSEDLGSLDNGYYRSYISWLLYQKAQIIQYSWKIQITLPIVSDYWLVDSDWLATADVPCLLVA